MNVIFFFLFLTVYNVFILLQKFTTYTNSIQVNLIQYCYIPQGNKCYSNKYSKKHFPHSITVTV